MLNLMRCVNHAAIVAPQRLLAIEGVLREHKLRLDAAAETLRRTGRGAQAGSIGR